MVLHGRVEVSRRRTLVLCPARELGQSFRCPVACSLEEHGGDSLRLCRLDVPGREEPLLLCSVERIVPEGVESFRNALVALLAPQVALLVPSEVAMAAPSASPVALAILPSRQTAWAGQGAGEGPIAAQAPAVVVAGWVVISSGRHPFSERSFQCR
eukprot:6201392-Heterocapsa_arctica.AAC.1